MPGRRSEATAALFGWLLVPLLARLCVPLVPVAASLAMCDNLTIVTTAAHVSVRHQLRMNRVQLLLHKQQYSSKISLSLYFFSASLGSKFRHPPFPMAIPTGRFGDLITWWLVNVEYF